MLQHDHISSQFAHYSLTTPSMVSRYRARGLQATDEMLLAALQQVDPPLLGLRDTRAITHILGRVRGPRPLSMPSGELLARKVEHCRRKDVPATYVELLSKRLRKPKGLSEAGRGIRASKKLIRVQRNDLIRHLYPQFRDLQNDRNFIEHPILGRLPLNMDLPNRSERALWLVHQVMDERLGFYLPSVATIRNIVAKK